MARAGTTKKKTPSKAKKKPRKASSWTEAHARRLLWRAGFGPLPGQVDDVVKLGKSAAISLVVNGDGDTRLKGSTPTIDGKTLDPGNEFEHEVLWWLDRMVRTTHPLEERMTLFWHDHFATADVGVPLLIEQNKTLRKYALGSFDKLLRAVFLDPAMQSHLSVAGSHKNDPNENFARELFELYTLGAGVRYTEDDIREAARALTGWVLVRQDGQDVGVRFEPNRFDAGEKTIFGQRGAWGWEDVLRITLQQKGVAEFLVTKLWAEFVGTPLKTTTRRSLVKQFQASGRSITTLLRAILRAPQFYEELNRPDLVKSPVVLLAGLLRTNGWPVDRIAYSYLLGRMGQRPFAPPSVAGWDGGAAWCSTTGFSTRFALTEQILHGTGGIAPVKAGTVDPALDPAAHLALAKRALADPFTTPNTDKELRGLAATFIAAIPEKADEKARRKAAESVQVALRTLLVAGPDYQLL